jgi:hypothetical protein
MSSVNNQTIIDEYFFWYSENIRERIETQKGARILRYQFLEVYGNKDLLAIDKAGVLRYLNFVKNGKYTPAGKDKKNELKPYAPLTQFQNLIEFMQNGVIDTGYESEREMCLYDIATFKTLRGARKARKIKLWLYLHPTEN